MPSTRGGCRRASGGDEGILWQRGSLAHPERFSETALLFLRTDGLALTDAQIEAVWEAVKKRAGAEGARIYAAQLMAALWGKQQTT